MGDMAYNRRSSDGKLDEIYAIVLETAAKTREVHQRQIEITIPNIRELNVIVKGNGKPGLCDRMTVMETGFLIMKWVIGVSIPFLMLLIAFLQYIRFK